MYNSSKPVELATGVVPLKLNYKKKKKFLKFCKKLNKILKIVRFHRFKKNVPIFQCKICSFPSESILLYYCDFFNPTAFKGCAGLVSSHSPTKLLCMLSFGTL